MRELVAQVPGATAATHLEACKGANFVFLATPGGDATLDVFKTLFKTGCLEAVDREKVVVDLTNPFALDHLKSTSGGEMLQAIAGDTVHVVKTLNTCGHNLYNSPTIGNEKVDMFVAGNNEQARKQTLELVGAMGFNPVDAGGIAASRWMEALCYGWVHMAHNMGLGREIGWKLLRK